MNVEPLSGKISLIQKAMSVEEKVGQLLMLDFRFWDINLNGEAIPFTKPSEEVSSIISKYHLGGIALFKENTAVPKQIIELINSLQHAAKIPLLLGIDQEGGLVTRIQTGTDMPGNMALGAANDPKLTFEVAKTIGDELSALKINLNFAPTIDVNSNQSNPIIGIRSFGSSSELVSKMGVAYIEGLKASKTLSCVKHFPGHGNTNADTHLGLAVVDYSLEDIHNIDLAPFREAFKAGVETIMIAHVIVPALDDSKQISKKDGKEIGTPATLSYKITTELLRNEMNFEGIVLTDALDMKAISDNFGAEEAGIKTILAGSDMAVMPVRIWRMEDIPKLDQLIVALKNEYHTNAVFAARVEESVSRLLLLKAKHDLLYKAQTNPDSELEVKKAEAIIACKYHRDIERKAASAGITLVKNDDSILPFNLSKGSRILIVGENNTRIRLFSESLSAIAEKGKTAISVEHEIADYKLNISAGLKNKIRNSDFIIILTYNITSASILPDQIAISAKETEKKCAVVACRNPYDISQIPNCAAYLAIYGAPGFDQTNYAQATLAINLQTAPYAIFAPEGEQLPEINPRGKLPVDIFDTDKNILLYHLGHGLNYK